MLLRFSACLFLLTPVLASAADATRLDRSGDPLPEGAVARYGSVRLRHPGEVKQLAFSRDGKTLASLGGQPGTSVILWDVETGKAKARLDRDGLFGVAFGPDGTLYLATAEPACLAWDPVTGKTRALAVVTVKDETRAGRAVAVSPDGTTVAVGCEKGTIVWLDVAGGKERGRLERREKPDIQSLIYSHDGQTMAVQAGGADVFLVDTKRHRATRSYKIGGGRRMNVNAVALSPDGVRLAVAAWEEDTRSHVRVFETDSDQEIITFPEPDVYSIALHVSPDGQTLRSVTQQGHLQRWTAPDEKPGSIEKVTDNVAVAAFAPTGKRVAVADAAGFIRIYETTAGKVLAPSSVAGSIVSASFAGREQTAVVTRGGDGTLNLWARGTGQHLKTITTTDDAHALSPDGTRLVTWNAENSEVRVLDPNTAKELWRIPVQNVAGTPSFSRDGRRMAVVRIGPVAVDVWDVVTGRRRATLKGENNSEFRGSLPIWSPDGRYVLAFERSQRNNNIVFRGNWNGGMQLIEGATIEKCWIWEVATEQVRWSGPIPVDANRPERLAWVSPGLRMVAIQDRVLATFRVGQTAPLTETMIPADATTVAVSSDDRWFAVGLKSGAVHVWEPNGTRRLVAAGHTGAVASLTFSADSKRLLSASEDGTALLWDVVALPALKPAPPTVPRWDPERHWAALTSAKGVDVLAALDALAAHPAATVKLVRERVRPVAHADAKRLERLVSDLGDAKFEVRERAYRELTTLGERAEPALRAAEPVNAEARKRIEVLLAALDGAPTDVDVIRQIRAVEALERVGTTEARELLDALSHGDPAAHLTKEAAAAMGRTR